MRLRLSSGGALELQGAVSFQPQEGHWNVGSQVEAVENHMPEVVIVDEIGTEAEALACRTIAGGVSLISCSMHSSFCCFLGPS